MKGDSMRVQIRSSIANFDKGPGKQRLAELLERNLGRFERRIKSVQVFIEDVNGPKGGVDKECRCVVHLRRLPPVVIRDADECLTTLAHRVANRTAHAVRRCVSRKNKLGLSNRQRIGDVAAASAT